MLFYAPCLVEKCLHLRRFFWVDGGTYSIGGATKGKPNHCWYTSDIVRSMSPCPKLLGSRGDLGPWLLQTWSGVWPSWNSRRCCPWDLTNRCGADWIAIGCYLYSFKESDVSATLWRFIIVIYMLKIVESSFNGIHKMIHNITLKSQIISNQYPSTFRWWSHEIVRANFWLWMAMWQHMKTQSLTLSLLICV